MVAVLFILLFVVGVCSLFPRSITVSAKSELRKPKTVIFGSILIITSAASYLFLLPLLFVGLNPAWVVLPILIPIVATIILKQPKDMSNNVTATRPSFSFVNVIMWVFLTLILIGGLVMLFGLLKQ